ncbi:MAG: glycosyltransferase [Pseudomonadota bacterium]
MLTIVAPVYNNASSLEALRDRVKTATSGLACEVRFVFVDDASVDASAEVLSRMEGHEVTVFRHDTNVGQAESTRDGLKLATGDVIVVMDADLQDPPEAVPSLVKELSAENLDAVFAGRIGQYQSGLRMLASKIYRAILMRMTDLPPGAGGFVAMTGAVANDLATHRAERFYLVGLLGCRGYRLGAVPVQRDYRAAGQSGYSFAKRLKLGLSNLAVVFRERKRTDG